MINLLYEQFSRFELTRSTNSFAVFTVIITNCNIGTQGVQELLFGSGIRDRSIHGTVMIWLI